MTTDYLDGFQYFNNVLQFFPTAEGYVKNTVVSNQNTYDYVYNYTDHLGNIRLSYMKDPTTGNLKILEENHYYPFGLKHSRYAPLIGRMAGINNDTDKAIQAVSPTDEIAKASLYKYKFGAKEWQDELGLGLYDYHARLYDPALGRWVVVDPLADAEKNIRYSPYSYAINNPISYIDPDGRCWQKVGESYVPCDKADVGSTTTGAFGHSWTMSKNDGWQLTNGADPSTVNYEYDYIEATGDKSYYVDRYKNHIEKYNTRPPDYYLEYGYNNKVLFDQAYPDMSDVAKDVFDKIGPGLQNAMNDGIKNNPSLQGSNDEFKAFAYETHFPVYKNSGVGKLGGGDLLKMAFIPKMKDTFGSKEGWSLIMKLVFKVVGTERQSKVPERFGEW